jgi:hypothetical protein
LEEIIQIKKAVEPEIKTQSKKRKLSVNLQQILLKVVMRATTITPPPKIIVKTKLVRK